MTTHKTCTRCKVDKPLSDFYSDKRATDGRRPECKKCSGKSSRKWYDANKERASEISRQWKENNPERSREYTTDWYKANKERITENHRQYYQTNKERFAERAREWLENNRERWQEYSREWRQANPDKEREKWTRYRANKKNAEGFHTADDIESILHRQRGRCVYCQTGIKKGFSIDHMVPLSRGGSNWPDNIQLLCPLCNSSKGDKTHEEYLQYLVKVRR